jgi:hypothetical protein
MSAEQVGNKAKTASGPILAVQLNFSLVAASGRKADVF